MAQTNQVIENKIIGDRVTFLVTSEDSKGKLLRVELWCKPNAQGPPMHYHPLQTETFRVVKGQLVLNDKGKEIILKEGEKYKVAANSIHNFRNASAEEEVLVIVDIEPALKTEFFFETMYSLAHQNKTDKNALPKNPLQFAALLHEYYGEMFAVGPPIFLQKFIAKLVGSFAKGIGYKGYIPFKNNI